MRIEVNNIEIEAKPQETILSALKRIGIKIPTLCYLEGLLPNGHCRLCLVELVETGELISSCLTPVSEGLKIKTHSEKVIKARNAIVELLFAAHPDDCLYCDRKNNCELLKLGNETLITRRRLFGAKNEIFSILSNPAIIADMSKCVLCGRCIKICENINGKSAISIDGFGSKTKILTELEQYSKAPDCTYCGQCISVCPTGALREQSHLERVLAALDDKNNITVAQYDPSIAISIGEEFGLKAGTDATGILNSAIKKIGFDKVFDTGFAIDLKINKLAKEFLEKINKKEPLHLITNSCCNEFIGLDKFKQEYIEIIANNKTPQEILSTLIKDNFKSSFNVSVVPCIAKKFEIEYYTGMAITEGL